MSSTSSFLLDDNLPSKLAKRLIQAGYSATSVALAGLAGQGDHDIFRYARSHALILITNHMYILEAGKLRLISQASPVEGKDARSICHAAIANVSERLHHRSRRENISLLRECVF